MEYRTKTGAAKALRSRRGLQQAVRRPLRAALPACAALVILAGVVLLPAGADLARSRWQRDCLNAKNADDQALSEAYERLIQAIPSDPVLAGRLARRRFGFIPRNEYVISSQLPELVSVRRTALPARPSGLLVVAAAAVRPAAVKTILLIIAAALCLRAFVLLARDRKSHQQQ